MPVNTNGSARPSEYARSKTEPRATVVVEPARTRIVPSTGPMQGAAQTANAAPRSAPDPPGTPPGTGQPVPEAGELFVHAPIERWIDRPLAVRRLGGREFGVRSPACPPPRGQAKQRSGEAYADERKQPGEEVESTF